jgi:hypothetical protein
MRGFSGALSWYPYVNLDASPEPLASPLALRLLVGVSHGARVSDGVSERKGLSGEKQGPQRR